MRSKSTLQQPQFVCHGRQWRDLCGLCSTLDDPVVMSNLMPWHFFASESHHMGNRWSLCAREICYKSKLLG